MTEINAKEGDTVYVGTWLPIDKNKLFKNHIIFHDSIDPNIEHIATGAKKQFFRQMSNQNQVVQQFFKHFFSVLGESFSKEVDHSKNNYDREYILSSLLSEKILNINNVNKNIKDPPEILIYPSVKDSKSHNIALKPETIERDFILSEFDKYEVKLKNKSSTDVIYKKIETYTVQQGG